MRDRGVVVRLVEKFLNKEFTDNSGSATSLFNVLGPVRNSHIGSIPQL